MFVVLAVQGHIFVDEGQELTNIMILEQGTLVRTKLSVSPDKVSAAVHHRRKSQIEAEATDATKIKVVVQHLADNSVTIDTLEGRGRVTGLLHGCSSSTTVTAFATVSVKSETARVWMLPATNFRTAVSSTPQHCLDMLESMARELRGGSKFLRGLMQTVHSSSANSQESGENAKSILKVLCYDTTEWVSDGFRPALETFNKTQKFEIQMDYTSERLGEQSATYAAGYDAVCLFVNDVASERVLQTLSLLGVRMIAMRCAGFDRVDIRGVTAYGLTVARVPAYSPYAVAEMAVSLLMAVNRKLCRSNARIKMANFSLDAGLMGMDIYGKTISILGTGKIGQILCRIMLGFGAKVICYDIYQCQELIDAGCNYVSQDDAFSKADVIFLMMPLLKPTYHTVNEETIGKMKPGVLLINTSRGGLMDTKAVLKGIRDGVIGGVGMDVYEYEDAYFFQDWSAKHIQDPEVSDNSTVCLSRLMWQLSVQCSHEHFSISLLYSCWRSSEKTTLL